jgi:uncharacterized iron-regulated membrane protein
MNKQRLLQLHRWMTLTFALPLAIVIVTGLILSVEPSVVIGSIRPGSLDIAKVEAVIRAHDPDGRARFLALQPYDNTAVLRMAGGMKVIDLETNAATSRSALGTVFVTSRRLHEALMLDAAWLVSASTVALLAIIAIGVLMGLPRLRNTVAGWHKGTGWLLLPLLVLSPLTGLAIAFGITLTGQAPAGTGAGTGAGATAPRTLIEAVRIVGARHDLAAVQWIRPLGGRYVARVVGGGEFRAYAVTTAGTAPLPRNWPRLLHEGNWYGHVSAIANVVISIALMGLLGTGLFMWARRKLRPRTARAERPVARPAAP